MNTTEQYISIFNSYIELLSSLSKGESRVSDGSQILSVLNKIQMDNDCHLMIRYAHRGGHGDKSWLYCYKGDKDTYEEEYEKRMKDSLDFFVCYNYDEIFNVFNHVKVESSEMGAWQAYLLSVATHFLPTCGHGAYSKWTFMPSYEQLKAKIDRITFRKPQNVPVFEDLSPSVKIEGNKATISCCYWNNWGGLVRRTEQILFINNRAYFIEDGSREVLVKYDCGVRY